MHEEWKEKQESWSWNGISIKQMEGNLKNESLQKHILSEPNQMLQLFAVAQSMEIFHFTFYLIIFCWHQP